MNDTEIRLNVLQVTEAANMGDHAQDITHALDVDPALSVGDIVREALCGYDWQGKPDSPKYDRYLIIRVAEPLAKRIADHAAVALADTEGPF